MTRVHFEINYLEGPTYGYHAVKVDPDAILTEDQVSSVLDEMVVWCETNLGPEGIWGEDDGSLWRVFTILHTIYFTNEASLGLFLLRWNDAQIAETC